MVVCLICANLAGMYHVIKGAYETYDDNSDLYLAASQISTTLMEAQYLQVSSKLRYIDGDNQLMTIQLDNGRIVNTPGFEIFAFNVDSLSFKRRDDFVYMEVKRNKEKFTFLIGSDGL